MAKAANKKSKEDTQRNSYVHQLAWQWLLQYRPDVVKACREAGTDKYPKKTVSRTQVELTDALKKLKAEKIG